MYGSIKHTHTFSIRFLIGRTCVLPVQDFLNLAATHYLMCKLLLLACKLSLAVLCGHGVSSVLNTEWKYSRRVDWFLCYTILILFKQHYCKLTTIMCRRAYLE